MTKGALILTIFVILLALFLFLIRDLYLPGEENATIQHVFCTADAKLCPDGSTVGRGPPSCEFAPCPGDEFLACEAAGNPIMESYPRQCRWPNGTTVMEVI